MESELLRVLGGFRVEKFASGVQPTSGSIRAYDEAEVLRHLSPSARRITLPNGLGELYEDGERFWLIDDRWGIVEINLLKSQWRAWLLRHPRIDPVRRAEAAVMWPLAQLLRAKGLYLLPAASVVRNGFGLLLLSPLGLTAELTAMARAGCRIVGQRWTALRDSGARIDMLHVPGMIELPASPRMRQIAGDLSPTWIDLGREHCGSELSQAPCTGVFVIAPGRRPTAHLRQLGADSLDVLRSGWPVEELHPLRRHGQLSGKLAERCACYEVALSHDPHDLVDLLGALPQRGTGIGAKSYRPPVMFQRRAVAG